MKYLLFLACLVFTSSAADDYSFRKGVNTSHWMAQHLEGKYADPRRLSEREVEWIVRQGFDHIRIPVDGRILMSIEGTLINELMEPFDDALSWAENHGLGVILDMHYLPGAEFLTRASNSLSPLSVKQAFTDCRVGMFDPGLNGPASIESDTGLAVERSVKSIKRINRPAT